MSSKELDPVTSDRLHKQLIKLGDMMGDGLHLEPDGKWIQRDYNRVAKALGYIKSTPRKNNSEQINLRVANFIERNKCPACKGSLKQGRKGAYTIVCEDCKETYKLETKKKRK